MLINKYPIISEFDYLYSKSRIEFVFVKQVIHAINELLLGNKNYSKLGDSKEIIDVFDNLVRVRESIEEML